ncbi:hypothetical protein D3C80_1232160 [compost metagenome]
MAARLEVRRNRDTAGTVARASSRRVEVDSVSSPRRITEKAASPAAGGNRAAVTMTSSTEVVWGWNSITRTSLSFA